MGDYVGDPYLYAKFQPRYAKMRTKWLLQSTAKTPAPIFTINMSNDVVSRKDVPFGCPTPFHPQTQIFGHFWRDKISRQKALNNGMLICKLPLIVIVAPWKLYSE